MLKLGKLLRTENNTCAIIQQLQFKMLGEAATNLLLSSKKLYPFKFQGTKSLMLS